MRQAAALPFRANDKGVVEVLLVTSSSGRWIIPKGDIDEGLAAHEAAQKEAFEEGGVQGRISDRSIGCFTSAKEQDGAELQVKIDVFPLEVTRELGDWPENEQRQRRWLPLDGAASQVEEQDLADLLRCFRP